MKIFTAPDGTHWQVKVQSPGSSNAIVFFRHPNGASSRLDRYNWFISQSPEARSVTARLDVDKVLDGLTAATLTRLFERSMPVSRADSLAPEPVPGVEHRPARIRA